MQTQRDEAMGDLLMAPPDERQRKTFTILVAESVATEKARTNVIRQRGVDIPDGDRTTKVVLRGARDGESLHIRVRRVGLRSNTSIDWCRDSSVTDLDFLEHKVTSRLDGKFERSITTRRALLGSTPRLWVGADGYLADTGATMACAMPENIGGQLSTVQIVDADNDEEIIERDQVRYEVGDYRTGHVRRKLGRDFVVAKRWKMRGKRLDTTTTWFRGDTLLSDTIQTVGGTQASTADDGFYWTTAHPNSCHDPETQTCYCD